jgi:hypothetical protein
MNETRRLHIVLCITSNLTKTVLKQLYLDNVKSVSDKPMRDNSSSSEVVCSELMRTNSQS